MVGYKEIASNNWVFQKQKGEFKMKRLGLSLLIIFLVVAIITPIVAAEQVEVGLVVMSTSSEYWLAVKAGAEKALEEVGGKLIYTGPATTAEVGKQVEAVENLINRQVDGIIVTPLDSDALVPPAKQAIAAGIPYISVDSGINWDGVTSTISTDNVEGGRIAMQTLSALLDYRGKVAIVNALAGIPSNDERNTGAVEIANKYDEIKLLPIQRGKDQAAAMANTENILIANPDLTGIFAGFDRGAIGAARALKNRGLTGKIKFVAFDANPEEIELLKEGTIDALIVQQPFEMGRLAVEFILKTRAGEKVPQQVNTPVVVVTKENMNDPVVKKVLAPTE